MIDRFLVGAMFGALASAASGYTAALAGVGTVSGTIVVLFVAALTGASCIIGGMKP